MLRRLRDGEERAAPVGRAAGEDVGEVPAGRRVSAAGLDLALHDAEHPAGADEGGEGAVDERLAAVPVPRGLRRGLAALGRGAEELEALLELVVALDVQLAVGGVVALVELVHHGVPDEAGVVVPGLAGLGRVVGADLEVVLPVAVEQLGDRLAVAGQAGGLERGAVVADAARADVCAVADDAALGVGRLAVLPVDPVVLAVLDAVVAQVDEGVRDVHDGAEPALLDRDDVAEAGAGGDLGEGVGTGVATGVDVGRLDRHVRVRLLVLLVEVVVAEGAEGGDGQCDLLVGAAAGVAVAAGAAGAAGQGESGDGCRGGCRQDPGAGT